MAGFLVPIFQEIGPSIQTGMGPVPISWRDLAAWQQCIEVKLLPWECRSLISMSREYVSFFPEAEKEDCPDPSEVVEITDEQRQIISSGLKSHFSSLVAQSAKPRGRVKKRKG
jgi:hypothetical protein